MRRTCETCGTERAKGSHARKHPGCGGRFVPAETVRRAPAQPRETSRRAGERAESFMGKAQMRVLVALARRGPEGGTDEEVTQELGTNTNGGTRARRVELESRGLVADSGKRRKNRSGMDAIVWVVTDRGREATAALTTGQAVCLKRTIEAVDAAAKALAHAKKALERTRCLCGPCTEETLDLFTASPGAATTGARP